MIIISNPFQGIYLGYIFVAIKDESDFSYLSVRAIQLYCIIYIYYYIYNYNYIYFIIIFYNYIYIGYTIFSTVDNTFKKHKVS